MKKNLTLMVDELVIDRAKRLSTARGKSLSQMVEDYFRLAVDPEAANDGIPPIHPDVLAITGLLAGTCVDVSDYHQHLVAKHS